MRASAAILSVEVAIEHLAQTPWASATFVGGQHRLRVTGDALDRWLAFLADADLPMRGHYVASCAVEREPGGAVLTILLLEE